MLDTLAYSELQILKSLKDKFQSLYLSRLQTHTNQVQLSRRWNWHKCQFGRKLLHSLFHV